jgi:hypothetical protein
MIKNTIICLAIVSLLYYDNVLSSEFPLTRQEGYWTTKEDLNSKNTKPLYQLIGEKNQREDWYTKTKYVAEPWCTVTNVPFLYVAYKFMAQKPIASATILSASIGSALSHAIPRKWLHHVDTLTALSAITGVIYDCNLTDFMVLSKTIKDPMALMPMIATGTMYVADVSLAHMHSMKPYRKKYQTFIHVIWHFIAAYTLYAFLSYATSN